jgi:hypothetical protein
VLGLTCVVAAVAVPLRIELRTPDLPMENGFMLALPARILQGQVANRDFDYFYGPISLWLPALVYKLFGISLTVERLIGFVYQCGVALGVFAIASGGDAGAPWSPVSSLLQCW